MASAVAHEGGDAVTQDYLAESGSAGLPEELRRVAARDKQDPAKGRPALQRLPSSKSVVGGVDSQA